jgi:hypothetical protein
MAIRRAREEAGGVILKKESGSAKRKKRKLGSVTRKRNEIGYVSRMKPARNGSAAEACVHGSVLPMKLARNAAAAVPDPNCRVPTPSD